jgi:predicted nucleotidyltransferase
MFQPLGPTVKTKIPQLWYKALRRRQAECEEIRLGLLRDLGQVLESLKERYSWQQVYFFGSMVRQGGFTRRSDVDIAILGLDPMDYYAFVGDISERLNRQVDVVRLEECRFADLVIRRGVPWTSRTESQSS